MLSPDAEIPTQIVAPPHHRDRRGVCQRDHQRKDDDGFEAKPPMDSDAMGCYEPALNQKYEKPREEHNPVGTGERRKRRAPFSGMGN